MVMLVWTAAINAILVVVEVFCIGVLTDVDITSEFAVAVSYFADSLSDMATDVIMGFVSDIGVEALANANVNIFASLMTALEFGLPPP